MAYTVKTLSELSGVTVRALHFYEEAGLLKPAYYGTNGYRYYEEKELLRLQQILFFKELGFSLKQIRKVLGRSDFDKLTALYSHKEALSLEWEKIGRLIKTVDRTIEHVKGNKIMEDREIFDGFILVKKGTGKESYFAAETLVSENLKIAKNRDKSELENIKKMGEAIYTKIANCMEKGLKPTSEEVQDFIKKHSIFAGQFHVITKKVYKALAQLYKEHPAFRTQLDPIHPKLADFIAKAMNAFADQELS